MIDYEVLIIEDDEGLNHLIKSKLQREKINVKSFNLGNDTIKYILDNKGMFLLILDYKLPDMSAQEIIGFLKEKEVDAHYIIITGHADVKTAVDTMKLGVKDYLIKDSNFLDLLPTVINRVFNDLKKEKKLKYAEEALHRSEESYRLLAESIIDLIWMTDLDLNLIYLNQSVNQLLGFNPEELQNENIDKMFTPDSVKKIYEFYYKVMEDHKNGHSMVLQNEMLELEQIHKDGYTIWTEVRISLMLDSKNNICGILGVSRDITGRKQAIIALNESFKTLNKALEASIEAMGKATEIRDPYTAGHQKRVGKLAFEIAKEMNLSEDQCQGVRLAGAIHDIGKIYVPAEILSKPGKISDNEFNIIKTHAQVGYDILKTIDFPWPIAKIVQQHHERINGSGYPFGIKSDEILIEAKIISVADVVEAMASYRPYRPALGLDIALDEIRSNKGILYDKEIVDICCYVIEKKGFKFD